LKIVYSVEENEQEKYYLCAFFFVSFIDRVKDIKLEKIAKSKELDKTLNFCGF